MKNNKTVFMVLGVIMLMNACLVNGAYISSGKFPESIMSVALTVMSFCMAYLSDHFAAKDERAQKIRERGVFVSYFWMIGIIIIMMALVNPYVGPLHITAYHLLLLIAALYISIVFLNMVYYARKY
jgi:MFS family permease